MLQERNAEVGESPQPIRHTSASWEGGDHMLARFFHRKTQRGQGLVEYSLIIALVAIVVIAILVLMGPQIGQIFSTITNGL